MGINVWGYREGSGRVGALDLTGYKVAAADGGIGKVSKHSDEVGSSYIVVDTGPWIFGREVLLPAGTVTRVDAQDKTIHVDRTKDEIESAPEFIGDQHVEDPAYYSRIGGYYGNLLG
ncbi:PRC-barrel domain-containing protein [Streptomyces sp. NPDC051578]|uniref:PRC-barrel domain-containing protein n=1 Tax=Streptomyces sp. NPDC051578 TaxID=3365662 RepID=UPI0037BD6E3F